MSPVPVRLKYISRFRDRHGHLRHYLRIPGRKAVKLPGEPGSPEFMAAFNAEVAAAAEDAKPPAAPGPAAGTLDAVAIAYYASDAFKGLRPSSQVTYRRIVEELRAKHGNKPVARLEPANIRALMAEKGEHKAAANHRLRILRALMAQAVSDKLIVTDPTFGVARLKREKTDGFPTWSEEEIAQYEAHWQSGTRPRLALALLLYTGQRRSDVVRMGRQHLSGSALAVRQVKTGKQLEIPIHPALGAELVHVPEGQMLFLQTEAGVGFSPNGFYMRFREWCDAAGIPKGRSPHGLRKGQGRRLAEAGATSHQIMAILGVTLAVAEIYTRAAEQKRLAAAGMATIANIMSGRKDLPTEEQ